jgi:hypothetical protein
MIGSDMLLYRVIAPGCVLVRQLFDRRCLCYASAGSRGVCRWGCDIDTRHRWFRLRQHISWRSADHLMVQARIGGCPCPLSLLTLLLPLAAQRLRFGECRRRTREQLDIPRHNPRA